ncbi:uncharacterized protein LOC121386693 [Gigantopelta aegis]|uniref:uncharacterized protein LOC121386693 n=1 Tax=Gigantopelta aegis TaxID=1735272 RepID=UPI001B88D724|nr:uncharacterized protein LOC121386693 [Gigantopelta aegis]
MQKHRIQLKRCIRQCLLLIFICTLLGHIIGTITLITHAPAVGYEENVTRFVKRFILNGSIVLQRHGQRWIASNATCGIINSSVAILQSPAGDTPIYVYPVKDDVYVSRSIIKHGMWEGQNVHALYSLMKRDRNADFVDIGANLGTYSLTFAKMGRRVLAIEPLDENVRRLCNSIRLGRFYREVYVIHNALSDRRYKVAFRRFKDNVGATQIKEADPSDSNTVEAVLLDDLLEVFSFDKVIVKLDVETHEARVLAGADNFFSTVDVRAMLMEWQYHRGREDATDIIRFLTKHRMMPFDPLNHQSPLPIGDNVSWPKDVLWIKY